MNVLKEPVGDTVGGWCAVVGDVCELSADGYDSVCVGQLVRTRWALEDWGFLVGE